MVRNDRVYTLPQAAKALVLPMKALRALIEDGTIPHIIAGGHILVELDAVEEAIAARARKE